MNNAHSFSKHIEIRWSDLDPNFHLRHSVYYDIGAFLRIAFLTENGLTTDVMKENRIGPILFREECVFKREIHFNDPIVANVSLLKCRENLSRWTMVHEIWKNPETLSAIITIDGAWIDTEKRKLGIPPPLFRKVFDRMPKSSDFHFITE